MYPIVKFTPETNLAFKDSVRSLFEHYSKNYLSRLTKDYPNFDNLSQQDVEKLWRFSGDMQDQFEIDLESCIQQEYGLLNNNNRENYITSYFECNNKFRLLLRSVGI